MLTVELPRMVPPAWPDPDSLPPIHQSNNSLLFNLSNSGVINLNQSIKQSHTSFCPVLTLIKRLGRINLKITYRVLPMLNFDWMTGRNPLKNNPLSKNKGLFPFQVRNPFLPRASSMNPKDRLVPVQVQLLRTQDHLQ